MRKEKITLDQLKAGALLKFGKVDSVDMTLLMGSIYNTAEIVQNENDYMNNCFILSNGYVELNQEYVCRFYQIEDRQVLERIQGDVVKKYMNSLNVLEFVLRKVKLFGNSGIVKDKVESLFSGVRMKAINELYKREFIEDYLHEDVIYGNYQEVRITQRGKLALFLVDNKGEVDSFLLFVRKIGYDNGFINHFLLSQDLDKTCADVLSLEDFSEFCRTYDDIFETSQRDNRGYSRERVPSKK